MRRDRPPQVRPAFVPGLAPDVGLLHSGAHEQREQRRQAADKKQRAPAPVREDEQVTERGEQVAGRITLLQEARHDAPQARRHFLHDE